MARRRAPSSAAWKSRAPSSSAAIIASRWRLVGQAAEEAGIEHGVEHAPALAQDAGEPGRGAHDGGDHLQQGRLLLQEREQLHPRGQLGEEPVEADEGEIGIGGLGERLDQHRLHLGEQLARARAAHGRVAPVVPAADQGNDLGGARVAHAGERLHGGGVVGLAGKHHVGAAARQLGAVLEEANVMGLHAFQLGGEAGGESVAVSAKPQKRASAASLSGSSGSVWVCSSAIICRRCSMVRRKR